MPSFPTSVFAPANKSAGQTIQAAHVNDVQDEVVAIESGYRTGTAPLNSSGSTVATLHVSGGSTFAGGIDSTVSFASSVTFSSGVSFASRPTMGPPDGARASATSTQTLHSSQVVVIRTLTTQDFITNSSMHSASVNSSRVTPQSTGLYRATGQIKFSINSTGVRAVQILDSSGGLVAITKIGASSDASEPMHLQCMGTKRFDAVGGYFRLASGSWGASTLSAFVGDTWLEVVKL